MDTQRFAVEPAEVSWKSLALDGGGDVQLQMYLKGADGGPEAIRARIWEGYEVEPHFHLAAQIQRAELDAAAARDDFERRREGGDVPARVSSGVLVAGGKIEAATAVELVEEVAHSLLIGPPGGDASDSDAAACVVPEFAHRGDGGCSQDSTATLLS